MNFDEWISFGIEQGWCGPPVCYTHDGLPMTEEESVTDDIDAYCMHIVRMYEDQDMKADIEENHSPSQWRNKYTN